MQYNNLEDLNIYMSDIMRIAEEDDCTSDCSCDCDHCSCDCDHCGCVGVCKCNVECFCQQVCTCNTQRVF